MIKLLDFELMVLDKIQEVIGTPIGDKIWLFFTHIGDYGLLWLVLIATLLIYPQTRRVGLICFFTFVLGVIITNGILKNVLERSRPFNYRDIVLLIKEPDSYSFPSGHTTASFAVSFVLLKEKLKLNRINIYIPTLVIAVLVAFSRVYLFVHFPTDIIAAIVIGYFCSVASRHMIEKITWFNKIQ